ncbi:MAG: hypothetical protein GX447_06415 [Elusimicrobia bacterium]|nr:hypothetical protein [Elusimicrobiota bacterium]
MKKVLLSFICALLTINNVKADSFEDFKTQIAADAKGLIKPFAADFGGVLGGNDFSSGRALGFPGFDIGISMAVQSKPSSENLVLKNAKVDAFGIPMVNAAVGLPFAGIDVMARGFSYSGLSIVGGGLRYNIFKSGTLTKFMPDLSVSAFYDSINYDYFKGGHMSFNLAASFDFPIIKPFAGIGFDKTNLEVKNVNPSVNGIDGSISKSRYTLGARLTVMPLIYIYGAYSSLHGQSAYNAGLGARF